jgi:hypothetical protein
MELSTDSVRPVIINKAGGDKEAEPASYNKAISGGRAPTRAVGAHRLSPMVGKTKAKLLYRQLRMKHFFLLTGNF